MRMPGLLRLSSHAKNKINHGGPVAVRLSKWLAAAAGVQGAVDALDGARGEVGRKIDRVLHELADTLCGSNGDLAGRIDGSLADIASRTDRSARDPESTLARALHNTGRTLARILHHPDGGVHRPLGNAEDFASHTGALAFPGHSIQRPQILYTDRGSPLPRELIQNNPCCHTHIQTPQDTILTNTEHRSLEILEDFHRESKGF
jgi:hypothetical protein